MAIIRGDWVIAGTAALTAVVCALLSRAFREAICTPYVSTVVRMEQLAAGDLATPFAYTDYKDCVGRMTRAMFTFRDTAEEQRQNAIEQAEVVAALRLGLAQLKEGDLTGDITIEFPEAYAELKTNFNEALASLRDLIGSVAEGAATIRTGSEEIAQASEDLARRTEANAASLEQTSVAVAQMDERLKATAEAAKSTVQRADGAIVTVRGGREIADEAVQAMTRVSDSAKGIGSVIEGLDKIAFQTRVLAMNAAIEAGRAGEAGRGFAVVADLVSALAKRAEEEAGNASDQLTATQSDILAAVGMVQKVDGTFVDIAGDVSEVHALLSQMADDNRAQSSAIAEINVAIREMDQSTQQNAAMVEETSAAARNLTGEVVTLSEQAGQFRIGDARRSAPNPLAAFAGSVGENAPGRVAPARLVSAAAAATDHRAAGEWASF
ncbi:methyl-accepting chemotaxis protein [Erythrobacter sp. QSSC1-22B]|uniref:methyl-accepting chemotaxis protein n=1 Tax=Erythrobacter sp. QSSC1-22B TaxID=1860125 RepID=UPI0035131DE3